MSGSWSTLKWWVITFQITNGNKNKLAGFAVCRKIHQECWNQCVIGNFQNSWVWVVLIYITEKGHFTDKQSRFILHLILGLASVWPKLVGFKKFVLPSFQAKTKSICTFKLMFWSVDSLDQHSSFPVEGRDGAATFITFVNCVCL